MGKGEVKGKSRPAKKKIKKTFQEEDHLEKVVKQVVGIFKARQKNRKYAPKGMEQNKIRSIDKSEQNLQTELNRLKGSSRA